MKIGHVFLILCLQVTLLFGMPVAGQGASEPADRQQKQEYVVKITDILSDVTFFVNPVGSFAGKLKENSDFNHANVTPVVFEYDYDHPKLAELKEKYDLETIAGPGDTQDRAIKLLDWLCSGTQHKGDYDNHVEMNALALLEYTFNQGREKGVNCFNLSIILSEMYLSVGIQARALFLMPQNPEDMDNHVVVMVWIPEKDKWIMLDPSFNAYFSDTEGNILSPAEIRKQLAELKRFVNGKTLCLNPDAKIDYNYYVRYMAKDMFYFHSFVKTNFGAFGEESTKVCSLCPKNFDIIDWALKNQLYRARSMGKTFSDEEIAQIEEKIRERGKKLLYVSAENFWSCQ